MEELSSFEKAMQGIIGTTFSSGLVLNSVGNSAGQQGHTSSSGDNAQLSKSNKVFATKTMQVKPSSGGCIQGSQKKSKKNKKKVRETSVLSLPSRLIYKTSDSRSSNGTNNNMFNLNLKNALQLYSKNLATAALTPNQNSTSLS